MIIIKDGNMKGFEKTFEGIPKGNIDGNLIDTPLESDLICGGVGFDDGAPENSEWLKELRNKQKEKINKESRGE